MISIFYGPLDEFRKKEIKGSRLSLSELVNKLEAKEKVYIQGKDSLKEKLVKHKTQNIIIESSEFLSVNVHVIENIKGLLDRVNYKNLYIHNPPFKLLKQLAGEYNKENYSHKRITKDTLKELKVCFSTKILGQESVLDRMLSVLYSLTKEGDQKPKVVLFYGPPGVGKTETAKVISDVLNVKLLRKQFSMYQSNDFAEYLFGGKHGKSTFAKDLIDRDSNVILIDEFDKCNTVFHSAFYQVFDEGVFEDENYKVNLHNAVIICTSNYKSIDEIKESIGPALYSRFDSIIKFNELSFENKVQIFNKEYDVLIDELEHSEKEVILSNYPNLKDQILIGISERENAREIRSFINECISLALVKVLIE